ncbi:MAG: ELWxxDGT repeat protein, partial [Acidobacteriota bacterium]
MKTSLCFALLLLWSAAAFGQPAFLVKDLGLTPSNGSSQPTTGVEIAGVLYFAAEDDAHGRELWRTDGTTEGTRRVSDICPGPCNGVTTTSLSEDTAVLSEVLFFVASDGVSGKELWRSDGTSRGTFRVRDLCPGRCSVGIRDLAAYDGLLYFAGEDPFTGGRTLWSTDGTRAATRPFPLADCGGSENPAQLRVGGGLLYFVASHPESGRELWRTNGTCQGTMLVKDICLDCPIAPRSLTAFEDRLLFWAFDVTHGYELWSTLGTPETTHLVVDLIPGPEGSTTDLITPFGGKLYYRLSFCPTDLCVYKTDGTAAGTEAAVELDTPGERPVQLLPVGNQLYFETSGISIGFRSLWVTDGEPATTRRVAEDFYPPMNLLADQAGWLLFGAQTEPGEAELWRSDGSAVGTAMVLDINPREGSAPRRGSTLGRQTLFVANDGVHGRELWRSDGSAAGTELVADLHPSASSAKPADLVAF